MVRKQYTSPKNIKTSLESESLQNQPKQQIKLWTLKNRPISPTLRYHSREPLVQVNLVEQQKKSHSMEKGHEQTFYEELCLKEEEGVAVNGAKEPEKEIEYAKQPPKRIITSLSSYKNHPDVQMEENKESEDFGGDNGGQETSAQSLTPDCFKAVDFSNQFRRSQKSIRSLGLMTPAQHQRYMEQIKPYYPLRRGTDAYRQRKRNKKRRYQNF